jgi:hypothetical protein
MGRAENDNGARLAQTDAVLSCEFRTRLLPRRVISNSDADPSRG